jgi:hypothetical protein
MFFSSIPYTLNVSPLSSISVLHRSLEKRNLLRTVCSAKFGMSCGESSGSASVRELVTKSKNKMNWSVKDLINVA